MKKFLSVKYSATSFNIAMLILRLGIGVLLASHGYDKLVHFAKFQEKFMPFLGLSPTISLSLVVFAEFFCAIFIVLGLFTRLAIIPIIIVMTVALSTAHNFEFFTGGEKAALYLMGALAILFGGPGRISVDGAINK